MGSLVLFDPIESFAERVLGVDELPLRVGSSARRESKAPDDFSAAVKGFSRAKLVAAVDAADGLRFRSWHVDLDPASSLALYDDDAGAARREDAEGLVSSGLGFDGDL